MNAADPIPLIDLAPLAGGGLPGAHEIAPALRTALEETGFLIITNHGVQQALIDATFAEAKRFHDQSLEAKLAVRMNAMPVRFLANHGRRNAISQSSRMMKHRLPNKRHPRSDIGFSPIYFRLTTSKRHAGRRRRFPVLTLSGHLAGCDDHRDDAAWREDAIHRAQFTVGERLQQEFQWQAPR